MSERVMTPLELEVLLHYSCTPECFHPWSGAAEQAIAKHESAGLMFSLHSPTVRGLTAKGDYYLNCLLSTPLPLETFIIPHNGDKDDQG